MKTDLSKSHKKEAIEYLFQSFLEKHMITKPITI